MTTEREYRRFTPANAWTVFAEALKTSGHSQARACTRTEARADLGSESLLVL